MSQNLYVPSGTSILHLNGASYSPDANGQITVPDNMVTAAMAAGCKPAQSVQVCTTAKRPSTNLAAGMEFFDSTLGKPIWRNAANTGWVDATGTVA